MEIPGNCVWVSLLERKKFKDPEIQGNKNHLSGKELKKQNKTSHSAPDNPALTVPSPSPRKSLDLPPLCVHPSQISPRLSTSLCRRQDPTQAGMLLSLPWGHPSSSRGPHEMGKEVVGPSLLCPSGQRESCQGRGMPVPWDSCNSRAFT